MRERPCGRGSEAPRKTPAKACAKRRRTTVPASRLHRQIEIFDQVLRGWRAIGRSEAQITQAPARTLEQAVRIGKVGAPLEAHHHVAVAREQGADVAPHGMVEAEPVPALVDPLGQLWPGAQDRITKVA